MSRQSASDSFPIARSNSSSLIVLSASIFSRSSASRVRWPTIGVRSSSGQTSGRSVRTAARPTRMVAAMRTLRSTTVTTPWPRATKTTAVAQPSPARTKNCHGCSGESAAIGPERLSGAVALVEISELIVEPLVERRLDCGRRFAGGRLVVLRPSHRYRAGDHCADRADGDGEQPRQSVEAFVDRHRQRLLAAVFVHVVLNDLVFRFPLVDHPSDLAAHIGGESAGAVANGFPAASLAAAHADELASEAPLRGVA